MVACFVEAVAGAVEDARNARNDVEQGRGDAVAVLNQIEYYLAIYFQYGQYVGLGEQ